MRCDTLRVIVSIPSAFTSSATGGTLWRIKSGGSQDSILLAKLQIGRASRPLYTIFLVPGKTRLFLAYKKDYSSSDILRCYWETICCSPAPRASNFTTRTSLAHLMENVTRTACSCDAFILSRTSDKTIPRMWSSRIGLSITGPPHEYDKAG
jgi:hypothetical protein